MAHATFVWYRVTKQPLPPPACDSGHRKKDEELDKEQRMRQRF